MMKNTSKTIYERKGLQTSKINFNAQPYFDRYYTREIKNGKDILKSRVRLKEPYGKTKNPNEKY